MFNKLFGIKKDVPAQPATPVTVSNENVDPDGFTMLNIPCRTDSLQLNPQGSLPNAVNTPKDILVETFLKPYDEIPFELSPAYSTIWFNNSTSSHRPSMKLKEIDWDSLCYDFTLEKSIIQS